MQTWADGARYEGGFINDLRHGDGSIHWANGEVCWLLGQMAPSCVYFFLCFFACLCVCFAFFLFSSPNCFLCVLKIACKCMQIYIYVYTCTRTHLIEICVLQINACLCTITHTDRVSWIEKNWMMFTSNMSCLFSSDVWRGILQGPSSWQGDLHMAKWLILHGDILHGQEGRLWRI